MLVQIENLGASTTPDFTTAGPATQFVSPSWTPPTSGLLIAWVFAWEQQLAQPLSPSSVVGNSIAWSVVGAPIKDFEDSGKAVSLVVADAAGSTTGTTTFNFTDAIQPFAALFARATRADLSAGAVAAIVRRPSAVGDLATSSDLVIPAPYSPHNGQIAAAWHESTDPTSVPGPFWELMDDLTLGGGIQRFATARPIVDLYQSSVQTEWFTNEAIWTMASAEIKAEPAGTRVQYPAIY